MVHTANVHITYRLEKGDALTFQELDDNFRWLDSKPSGGGSGATFDADFDTGFDPEASPDEDIIRLYVGNTIPGYSNVQSIVTLAANGFTMNMGQSNTYAIAINGNTLNLTSNTSANGTPVAMDGAPIIFIAGTASNTIYHANTKGGDIEFRAGNYNKYANNAIANTTTPATEGVVRVIGPNANTQAIIRFYDSSRDTYVGIRSPYSVDYNWILTLPPVEGIENQVLATDGYGNTNWVTVAGVNPSNVAFGRIDIPGKLSSEAVISNDRVIFAEGVGVSIDSDGGSPATITFTATPTGNIDFGTTDPMRVQNDGANLTTFATTLNFTGDLVASGLGTTKTITVTAPAPAGVIQANNNLYTGTNSISASLSVNTNIPGMLVTITPTSATSKIRIDVRWSGEIKQPWNALFNITRNGTLINLPPAQGVRGRGLFGPSISYYSGVDYNSTPEYASFHTWDSPNTTNSVTYQLQFLTAAGSADRLMYTNRVSGASSFPDTATYELFTSEMTATEYYSE